MQLKCMEYVGLHILECGPHLVHQRLRRRRGSGASETQLLWCNAGLSLWPLCFWGHDLSEGEHMGSCDDSSLKYWWEKHSGGKQSADVQDPLMQEPIYTVPAGGLQASFLQNSLCFGGTTRCSWEIGSCRQAFDSISIKFDLFCFLFQPRITWTEESVWLRCNVTKHSWLFTSHL